jgi:hypothetical protein
MPDVDLDIRQEMLASIGEHLAKKVKQKILKMR